MKYLDKNSELLNISIYKLLNLMLLHGVSNTEFDISIEEEKINEIGKTDRDILGYNMSVYIAPIKKVKR
jgi:hypothetical protein